MSMWIGTVGKLSVMVSSVEWLQVEGTGFKYVKKYFFFFYDVDCFEKDRKRGVRK